MMSFMIADKPAFADISGYNVQEWVDEERGVKIQFAYDPELPIIDAFTELRFSVQDVNSGEHLKDFKASVVVSKAGGERLFKFDNIPVNDGHFSVKYNFPDDGTHAVLLRLESNGELLSLASFSVFVPHQSPPSILDPFPKKPGQTEDDPNVVVSKILMVLLPVAAVVSIIIVLKKNKSRI